MPDMPKPAPSPGAAEPRGVMVGVKPAKPQPPAAETRDSAKMALQQSMDRRW